MTATYPRVPYNEELGGSVLEPGHYFIDTDERDVLEVVGPTLLSHEFSQGIEWEGPLFDKVRVLDALTSYFHSGEVGIPLRSSTGGQVMIPFHVAKDVVIPRELLLKTGHFYRNTDGDPVSTVQHTLYGDTPFEPAGFFDWLGEVLGTDSLAFTLDKAETIRDLSRGAAEEVARNLKPIGPSVLAIGAGLLLGALAYKKFSS